MNNERPKCELPALTPQQEKLVFHAWRCTPEELHRLILHELPRIQRTLTAQRPPSTDLDDTTNTAQGVKP